MKQNYLKEMLEKRNVVAGVEKKGFVDFYEDVKEGNISPILDEEGNVIGVNASTKITSNACMKVINGVYCHGANEEECKEDYNNAMKFQKAYEGKNVARYMILAVNLLNANLQPGKVVEDENGLYIYNVANRIVLDAYMNIVVDISDEYPSKYVNNATVLNKLDEKLNSYIEEQKAKEDEDEVEDDELNPYKIQEQLDDDRDIAWIQDILDNNDFAGIDEAVDYMNDVIAEENSEDDEDDHYTPLYNH